jgi:hypothetical protein
MHTFGWRLAMSLGLTTIAPATALNVGTGSLGGYLTSSELAAYLTRVATQYPEISSLTSIGQSVEGRDITALCLGMCAATDTNLYPAALVSGMHHSREPNSMMATVRTIQ